MRLVINYILRRKKQKTIRTITLLKDFILSINLEVVLLTLVLLTKTYHNIT